MPQIAKVIVEIALNREFDYCVPDTLSHQIRLGSRVRVPFGHSTARGYVVGFSEHSTRHDLKTIDSVIGTRPLLNKTMLKLARWMADYYAATIEQAVRTVLPCAIRRHGAGFKKQYYVFAEQQAQDPLKVEKLRQRAPKQAAVLDLLIPTDGMTLSALTKAAAISPSVVKSLKKKQFVRIQRQASLRDPLADQIVLPTEPLSLFPEQASALDLVKKSIDSLEPSVVLLHGVTGSGKTEVYLQAIRYVLEQDKGAIILVPEISLTPQTVERFRGRFGDAIAVLHSHLSDGERHDEWYRIYDGKARIVIGARSALFAPVDKLGLIVVDEEHEPSYKQSEAPRYHARDMAVMRGRMEHCAVLLGSASPALESFYNVRREKYALATLSHRVDHRNMPVMRIIDMRSEVEREGHLNVFSRDLMDAIHNRLDRAEQIILFLNRRGFATSMICPLCGHVATCNNCSVALTYHKQCEELRCHICGSICKVPQQCPGCGEPALKFTGIGTQRVESVIRKIFPKANVQRMDSDTTTRKQIYTRVLGDFRSGKIDILVGTQMIAKGLHFPGVTLVGVIYADLSLHMPDFRAAERTFQLLLQVAGRAGRGDIPGEVIVQTFTPFNPAIQAARRLDYEGFVDQEFESRRELMYPPFSHLICITMEGLSEKTVSSAAQTLVQHLRPELSSSVILAGPIPAPLKMAKRHFRYQIIMRSASVRSMNLPLRKALNELRHTFRPSAGIHVAVDVDALSMM